MASVIDLSQLDPPQVIEEINYEDILSERKAELIDEVSAEDREEVAEALEHESEPITKILEAAAYRELNLRQKINDQARAILAAYASGSDLDHIGTTYYATERQAGESDSDYLRRMMLAPDSWSTAGSTQSYTYHALSADPDIKDATAINNGAGEVLVTVLTRTGDGTAPGAILDKVREALNAEKVRPLNDRPTVQAAAVQTFDVVADLELREGPSSDVVATRARKAVRDYVDARHELGEDIVLGRIEAALYVEGVERVTLHEPVSDILRDNTQAAYCSSIEVTAGD